MTWAPKSLNHPTFGACELVPSILAIKWVKPLDREAIIAALSKYSLSLATEAPTADPAVPKSRRDPRAINVNQSDSLTWASGTISDNTVAPLKTDGSVEWVAPVYRASKADHGPTSYFAVNPKVLFLDQETAGAAGDVKSIDESASIDQNRGKLLKGHVVLNLPSGNAIEVADRLRERSGSQGTAGGIKFENIPYISPVC